MSLHAPALRVLRYAFLPFVFSVFLTGCVQPRLPDQHVDVTTKDPKTGETIRFVGDCDSISHNCVNATETITKKDGSQINRNGDMRDPTAPPPPAPMPPNTVSIPQGYTYIDPRPPVYAQPGPYVPGCRPLYDAYNRIETYICP